MLLEAVLPHRSVHVCRGTEPRRLFRTGVFRSLPTRDCFDLVFFFFCQEIIKIIQPVLLGQIIRFFEGYDAAGPARLHHAYVYAAGISVSTFALAVLHHLYFYHVQRVGMKIRVALCHMIYRKVSAHGARGCSLLPPRFPHTLDLNV